ncbi:MAG TPA: Uma2 family endonuclease [Gemmatimonadales bacterium]|nr:Uma2 family endonuclease [Gemmatimonadales bacterium]
MPALSRVWTREEVLALPDDGNRYELVDGELLVSPAPRWLHQIGVGKLHVLVEPYVQRHRLGITLFSPADLDLGSGQLVQPDLFVAGSVSGRVPAEWSEVGVPILIVEVLSPSTSRYDRIVKRRRYQASGVSTYWIVDLDARAVEVWTPGDERPRIISDQLVWQPSLEIEPLMIELDSYFREVWR